jgi:membrane-bound inhibitor of C-type lysozyme
MGAVAGLLCLTSAVAPASASPPATPNVVTYRCDGERHVVVVYPPYADAARTPIRLAWNGHTYLLSLARSGSGARYTSSSADLEWWNKGRGGFLHRLSTAAPLLTDCNES